MQAFIALYNTVTFSFAGLDVCTVYKGIAAFEDIAPGGFEIASIPRVGNIASPRGEIEQLMNFSFRIASTDAIHIADVPIVHAYQQIETMIVVSCHLSGRFALARNTVFGQFPFGWGIYLVAYFLCRSCRRLDIKLILKSCLCYQILHHKFCHRTSADITMTDKKYLFHASICGFCGIHRAA